MVILLKPFCNAYVGLSPVTCALLNLDLLLYALLCCRVDGYPLHEFTDKQGLTI